MAGISSVSEQQLVAVTFHYRDGAATTFSAAGAAAAAAVEVATAAPPCAAAAAGPVGSDQGQGGGPAGWRRWGLGLEESERVSE